MDLRGGFRRWASVRRPGRWAPPWGPLPSIPVLAAIPSGPLEYAFVALIVPVLAGVVAGWWFLREGENHFDEWLAIKIHARWFTATVSTLVPGRWSGLARVCSTIGLAWVARGSAGLGRLPILGRTRSGPACGWRPRLASASSLATPPGPGWNVRQKLPRTGMPTACQLRRVTGPR